MSEEKKVSYTGFFVKRASADAPLSEATAMVVGFVNKVHPLRTVNVKGKDKSVTSIEINAIIPDKRVESMFGKDFVNETYHSVRFRISVWGVYAENLVKYPPQKGQKACIMLDRMKAEAITLDNGNKMYVVEAQAVESCVTVSARKPDGESALVEGASNAQAAPKAPVQSGPAANDMDSFTDVDDDDLPF